MSALVVDTSAWIAFFRGAASPDLEAALDAGQLYLPPIVRMAVDMLRELHSVTQIFLASA